MDIPYRLRSALVGRKKADVVMLVGRYFVGREVGFRPEVKCIRVEPDDENIGRVMPVEVGIVSDEKAATSETQASCFIFGASS